MSGDYCLRKFKEVATELGLGVYCDKEPIQVKTGENEFFRHAMPVHWVEVESQNAMLKLKQRLRNEEILASTFVGEYNKKEYYLVYLTCVNYDDDIPF